MTEAPIEVWIEENVTVATGQTVAFGAAMVGLGVWLGNNATTAFALAEWPVTSLLTDGRPEWIATVEQLNYAALAVFAVGILAVVAMDYMVERRDSNDTDG